MAGLDALSGANASAQAAAAIDAEIAALAADAEALKGLLDVGSTARAVVLKSNGLTDLLQIVGQRVAASLPPDLKPGEVIYVQVTGFEDGHINLQIVSAPPGEPGAPAPTAPPSGTPPQAGTPTSTPVAPGTLPPATVPASGGAANLAPPAAASDPPLAPPVSVFVAASVIRAVVDTAGPSLAVSPGQANPAAVTVATTQAPAGSTAGASESGTGQLAQSAGGPAVDAAVAEKLAPSSAPELAASARPGSGRPSDIAARLAPPEPIEARIAALRAASAAPTPVRPNVPPPIAPRFVPPPSVPIARPNAFVAPPFVRPSGTAAGEPPRITPGSPKPIGQGFASVNSRFSTISPQAPLQSRRPIENPVPIRTRGDAALPDPARAPGRAAAPATAERAAIATTAPTRGALTTQVFRDPAVLLRALRVPVTQTNLASATLALQTPHRVPAALAALERALPDGRSDPRVATLRTIVGFIGRLDPQSPTLASQIAAYVSHVVDGGEPKLATLLQSYLAQAEPGATPTPTSAGTSAPAAQAMVAEDGLPEGVPTAQSALVAAAPAGSGSAQPLAAAQTLIAQAAHEHDLKTTLQTLIAVAPSGAATPAAQTVLAAITGVQLDVASALAQSPQQVTFTIPLPLVHPDALAHVTIDRNRPDDAAHAIDGDNFHIAFILTTKHLGTVTIDLRTVGRAVNVGVHTEAELAAHTFGGALGRLKDRLETLRYNVTSIESSVAPRADRLAQPEQIASAQARGDAPVPDEQHDVDDIA